MQCFERLPVAMECETFHIKIQLPRGILLKGLSAQSRRNPQNSASQLVSSRCWSTRLRRCAKASRHAFKSSFISPKSIHILLWRKSKLFRPGFLIFCSTFRLKKQNMPASEQWETGLTGFYIRKKSYLHSYATCDTSSPVS